MFNGIRNEPADSHFELDAACPVVRDCLAMRRGHRPRRTFTKRFTPIRRRSAVVLALATAGAMAVTGIALATGTSTTALSFSPGNPHGVVTSGRLYFGTRTDLHGRPP